MKSHYLILALFCCVSLFAQPATHKAQTLDASIKIEDQNGHLITDSQLRAAYLKRRKNAVAEFKQIAARTTSTLTPVSLCTNGTFEEFETIGGNNVLKNFGYDLSEPLNPIQCKVTSENGNFGIRQYDPSLPDRMASTVPSAFLDEFIGNINGFDQFVLKLNYKHTEGSTMGLVHARRFKTDNETYVKFNYKAVLQTIPDGDHQDEQPYFKARIVGHNGAIVDEFCLIGDPTNCIFETAPNLEGGNVVLYTPNWQSGTLDISSIPNNEDFTIEFMAARCGLGGHFGYAYVDDICLLHSNENLQGSIELDPLYKICPAFPVSVCGSFTIPNSNNISATVNSIVLTVRDASNAVVYTSTAAPTIDMNLHRFCFDIQATDLPNVTAAGYNVGAAINYGLLQTNCSGTNFESAKDDDANPGWDIWFLNCTDCDIDLHTASLRVCDSDHNGTETFDLASANNLVTSNTTGLTFSYYNTVQDAAADTNPITGFNAFASPSKSIFVRATKSATCYKIIPISLIVKNPTASISGILNVCSGSTVLTASPGTSYLWGNGATTQSISVSAVGTYTVAVTDTYGCVANGSVTILSNLVAVSPTIVVTQPNCFSNTGTIAITSPASQYSYDNGVTWSSNSSMSNLPLGTYKVKIRTAAGCTSYASEITLVPFLSEFPDFSAVHPNFCGDLGSITITTPASMYSFDDGATWTTTNTLGSLPSGTYLIRVKDALGCISNFNSVVLDGEFLQTPEFISNNPYCGTAGGITITTPAAAYSFDGGITWQASDTLGNLTAGSYIIKIKNSMGCTSPTRYVYLTDLEDTYPDYTIDQAGCGVYASIHITTPGDAYSFDGGVTWQTSNTISNLPGGNSFLLRVRKGACLSRIENAYIYSRYLVIPEPDDYETTLCDDLNDGSEPVDLTAYNSNLIANAANYTFTFFKTAVEADNGWGNQISNPTACILSNTDNKVYVRVTSAEGCHGVAILNFAFLDSPVIVLDESFPLCVSKTVTIDAGNFDNYLWPNGETTRTATFDLPGTYDVTVMQNHATSHGVLTCSSTKSFTIFLSNPAKITEIKTFDWTDNYNTMTVYVDGLGDYEYSLDGINYQDSPFFYALRDGDYKVYVHDKNECGTVDRDVFLLMYPRFFTPNDDTYNDIWKVRLSETEPGLTIKIFDRDGKLLKELGNKNGWDGKYNGADMPASDYWFVVTRSNGKELRGHFTLKR